MKRKLEENGGREKQQQPAEWLTVQCTRERDVNVLLTLPLQDPTVIKAFLETGLPRSLGKSVQKNITAGGVTGV